MSQKLLKAKKTKIAPKKDAVMETDVVLVGTYKEKQLAWIKANGVYNYPVKDGDELTDEACAKVKELWLYADVKSTRHAFAAEFMSKMSRDEFVAAYPTYAKLGKPKNKAYYVFKTTLLDYGPAHDGRIVVARTADFGGRSAKVKKAIERFKADGEFAPLAAYLPSDLAKVPRQQLRVCEAAVQLDFFPGLLKPVMAMKKINRPKFTFFDLFAGCGGLSLGLERAGFTPLLVNELNPDAMSTYLLNRRDEFPWLCDNNVSMLRILF